MFKRLLILTTAFILIFPTYAWKAIPNDSDYSKIKSEKNNISFTSYSSQLYQKINDKDLNFNAFNLALKGYLKLQNDLRNNKYLTIIDMSATANTERFFIINMETEKLEHKSLVAHGRNSGLEFAKHFSNTKNSHQTSLGFYKTAETYTGKHGYSLRLDGLEFSNDKARERAIVIHQADYASAEFIKKNGRLGRSYGCPSLPSKDYKTIIGKIKNGSCLFIYYPKKSYLEKSAIANADDTSLEVNS